MKLVDMASFRHWKKKLENKGVLKNGRRRQPAPKIPAALLRSLMDAYTRADCFRREKVMEIKGRIARGEYHVSGKDVVDKWFPLSQEKQTRD
ncbi:MAG: flagellar biosynthesis anti-sigma factor FlgM [candidate division FCPU426 bacterium]